jgi:hypothetical protein
MGVINIQQKLGINSVAVRGHEPLLKRLTHPRNDSGSVARSRTPNRENSEIARPGQGINMPQNVGARSLHLLPDTENPLAFRPRNYFDDDAGL